jgi:serine/threonine protein kinase
MPNVPAEIAGRWVVLERLGQGCFADVYKGRCKETQRDVAIKFEENNRRNSPDQLESEVQRLRQISNSTVAPQGFAEVFYHGSEPLLNVAVMDLLGKSLEDHLDARKGTFTVQTTVLIAEQGLLRLEYLHSKGIIHRDIKPENWLTGTGHKLHHIYLIDMGLSQVYYDQRHSPMATKLSVSGNARYASLNNHRGMTQSRRDDLEAFGHMLFQFLLGTLPWTGLSARSTEEKYTKIREKKEATSVESLCKGFPEQFGTYLSICRNLGYSERPDYAQLRGLFTDVRRQIDQDKGTVMLDHEFEFLQGQELPAEGVPLLVPGDILQPDDEVEVNDQLYSLSWRLEDRAGGYASISDKIQAEDALVAKVDELLWLPGRSRADSLSSEPEPDSTKLGSSTMEPEPGPEAPDSRCTSKDAPMETVAFSASHSPAFSYASEPEPLRTRTHSMASEPDPEQMSMLMPAGTVQEQLPLRTNNRRRKRSA